VPVDREVAAVIQGYLLTARPETASQRLFIVAKGPTRGQPLTPGGVADDLSLPPQPGTGAGGASARVATYVRDGAGGSRG
jgi:hypothetical protein